MAYGWSMQRESSKRVCRAPLRDDGGLAADEPPLPCPPTHAGEGKGRGFWPDHFGGDPRDAWSDVFRIVRAETERRAASLSPEDQVVQSMPDASPIKWHRAHTTWFFEQFVLGPHAPSYRVYDPRFAFLFNSYYVAAGPRHTRANRGLLTRPDAADVTRYRAVVEAAIMNLLADAAPAALSEIVPLIELGLHHEQQHQELMLTDIMHAFSENPIAPVYDPQ